MKGSIEQDLDRREKSGVEKAKYSNWDVPIVPNLRRVEEGLVSEVTILQSTSANPRRFVRNSGWRPSLFEVESHEYIYISAGYSRVF